MVDRKPGFRAYGMLHLLACVVGGLRIYAAGARRDAKVDLGHMFVFVITCACAAVLFLLKPKPGSAGV